MPLIFWMFLLPLIGGLYLLISNIPQKKAQYFALTCSLVPLLLLFVGHWQASVLDSSLFVPWLSKLGINFHLRVDSLSMPFLYLNAIVVPIAICVAQSNNATPLSSRFYALILILESFLIPFFTARNLVLFIVFWEAILFPVYFIILFWGGSRRQRAATKFLIYMIAGSALLIAAALALYFLPAEVDQASFELDALAHVPMALSYQKILFAVFLLAFAVKTPLFPLHIWLPLAYTQAPTSGSILLAALLSKAGIYALLRIGLEIFPAVMQAWSLGLAMLACFGVLYAAITAAVQNDFKQLIAYSSLSHVNLILVGLFIWDPMAHSGAVLQAFNHGITITALFVVAHWLEKRLGSTAMGQVSGLAAYVPRLCWITLIFALSTLSLPSTNNFVGELMILVALFKQNILLAAILTLSIIFSAIYMLRWMQRIYFGAVQPHQIAWHDIGLKELLLICPLILLVFGLGLYPAVLLNYIQPFAHKILSTAS